MKKLTYRGLYCGEGLLNPERGFRFEIGVGRLDNDGTKFKHIRKQWPFEEFKFDGVRIAQAYCYLTQYYDQPLIAQEKLDALQADFDKARAEGAKFLLRFAYEFNSSEEYAEKGPTLEILLGHIRQLTEIVRKNLDVIYVLQIGWVGLWGEFHTSVHHLEKDPRAIAAIVKATLEMLPEDELTMMRCMRYKDEALKALNDDRIISAETAFTNAPHARIGFFNDGTLANYWDGGTFWDPPHSQPGNWEFDRVAQEGYFMPVDGELFWTGQFNSPDDATGLMAAERFTHHHYTTFSLVHGFSGLDQNPAPWTIDTWKQQMFTPGLLTAHQLRFDPDWFGGKAERSAFDYIRDHLGYRLAVTEAEIPEQMKCGEKAEISAVLKNYGFSTVIKKRFAGFVLVSGNGDQVIELGETYNMRDLQPAEIGGDRGKVLAHRVDCEGVIPANAAKGKYSVAMWMPDNSEKLRYNAAYGIRLASNVEVREVGGRLLNILGETEIV